MPRYENAATVPFIIVNGHRALSRKQLDGSEKLRSFVKRFRSHFRHDLALDVWFFSDDPIEEDE